MVGMELIQILMLVVTSIFMTAAQTPLCTPGEELQPDSVTLNINTTVSQSTVRWLKETLPLVLCINDNCQLEPGISGYTAFVSVRTSTLIIFNVTRQSAGTYICESKINPSCDLTVYAGAKSVSCQQAVLQADTVTVVCTVTRIYPFPICQFEWIKNATENYIIQDNVITYNNLTGNGDPDYFNVNCSLKLPARNFSVGAHQFHVRVYPNVTGRESDKDYGIDSQTSPQTVVYPVVVLLSCPETFVQENTQFICSCRETANTFILPTTTLLYGSTRVNSTLQHVTANITANRNASNVTCQAVLPDGTNDSKTQKLEVAYGPSNVLLRVFYNQTEDAVISLCDQTGSVTVTVTCSVSVNDVSPGVNYQFYSNITGTSAGPPNVSARNYTVTSGGIFYVLCTGINSQFPTLSATSTIKIIQVTVPGSQEGKELNVGAVVGGVVAGVFVIAAASLLVVFLKRRGRLPNRGNEDRNADGMLNIPHKETKEESPAHTQASENSHYEEIIDVQYDIPDKPVYYANQILSNIHGEEVQYENTVCAL